MDTERTGVGRLRRSTTTDEAPDLGAPPPYPWKTRIAVPAVIGLAMLGIVGGAFYDSVAPAVSVRVAPVIQKSTTTPGAGSAVVQAAGWIEPDPYLIQVSALADGIVEEVVVLEGDAVEAGQVVARLVDDDAQLELQHAEAALSEADANLVAARAALAAAETDWENPVELNRGVSVTSAALDEAKALLKQVDAEILAEQAVAEEAERAFTRAESLLRDDDVGTEADLDRVRARYLAALAMVDAKRNQRATVQATIARLEAELSAAKETRALRTADRERLDNARASVRRAEALVDAARAERDEKALQYERMEVRSPVDGVVVRRLVSPGAKVVRMMDSPHSNHVVHLYDPERLQVRVDVPLVDAALVGVGQAAEIGVEVLPDATFSGTVSRVTHEADLQKNTLEVKVAISDPRPELRPEMLARVKFLAMAEPTDGGERLVVMVSKDALLNSGGGTQVWVVDSQRGDVGVARLRPVVVRGGGGEWVETAGGLNPGDRVVLNPSSGLEDGARVRVISAAQSYGGSNDGAH